MQKKLEDELDQLTDEEIEKRLAAAVWVDDKRAAVAYSEKSWGGKRRPKQLSLRRRVAPKTLRGLPWMRLRRHSGRRTSPSP